MALMPDAVAAFTSPRLASNRSSRACSSWSAASSSAWFLVSVSAVASTRAAALARPANSAMGVSALTARAYLTTPLAPIACFGIPPDERQPDGQTDSPRPSGKSAILVGAGIFLSRIAGIGREAAVAGFIGAGRTGDAYRAALIIPRLLQNLLGEGVLSASFIPIYSQLVEQGRRKDAGRLAGAVFGLLAVVTGLVVLAGWVLAKPLVSLLLWRLSDDTTDLTVELVRVMFAGIGFIVLAAWALGVLNAHRRFFLSYAAPVIWNAAQIAFMVGAWLVWHDVDPTTRASDVARLAAWGVVLGGALQFLVQVPLVLRLVPTLRLNLSWRRPDVRIVLNRFWPALIGRGVVQVSAYVDLILAGLLAGGAIAALGFAQVIYFLPISLFAMSVAASDLPEMVREQGDPETLLRRLQTGLDRIGFYVLFSAVAFITMGGLIVGALLERGQFNGDQTVQVWWILAAYSLGLVATASARLLQNACFAAGDAKGPARVAVVRVLLGRRGGGGAHVQLRLLRGGQRQRGAPGRLQGAVPAVGRGAGRGSCAAGSGGPGPGQHGGRMGGIRHLAPPGPPPAAPPPAGAGADGTPGHCRPVRRRAGRGPSLGPRASAAAGRRAVRAVGDRGGVRGFGAGLGCGRRRRGRGLDGAGLGPDQGNVDQALIRG